MSEHLNDPTVAVVLLMGFFLAFYGVCVLAINFTKWFD